MSNKKLPESYVHVLRRDIFIRHVSLSRYRFLSLSLSRNNAECDRKSSFATAEPSVRRAKKQKIARERLRLIFRGFEPRWTARRRMRGSPWATGTRY